MRTRSHYKIEGDPDRVFVPVPGQRALYRLVSRYVIEVACPYCDSPVGVPCTGQGGRFTSYEHAIRRPKYSSCRKCRKKIEFTKTICRSCAEKRDRIRRATHSALYKALRRGDLVRPSTCERCGKTNLRPRHLHAHHASYAPEHHLDVEWLCTRCHAQERVTERKAS